MVIIGMLHPPHEEFGPLAKVLHGPGLPG